MSASFISNAEEIRAFTKELLADGAIHTKDEIRSYVNSNAPSGGSFTDGMFSGALYDLVINSNGAYFSPSRGRYQKKPGTAAGNTGESLKQRITDIINSTCHSLNDACTLNIIGLSQKDIEIAGKVSEIISTLKQFTQELSE